MNRIVEAVLLVVLILLLLFAATFFIVIIGNALYNERQEADCDKMREYGYSSFMKVKQQPVIDLKECWIRMEDGMDIRSDDYSIADNRKARLNKNSLIELNDTETRR